MAELKYDELRSSDLRHELEQACRRAEAAEAQLRQLREAVDAIPEGLVLLDAQDRYVFWNKAYETIYAAAREKLAVRAPFREVVEKLADSGAYVEAFGRTQEWVAERMRRHAARDDSAEQAMADGRIVRVAERPTSEGGAVGVHIDISELKQRERTLRAFFENNPIPAWVVDRKSLRFVTVNQAAVEFYGYSREQFMAMSTLDIRPAQDRAAYREAVRRLSRIEVRGLAFRHIKANGQEIEVEVYSRPIEYEGVDCFVVAVVDVSERMEAERRISHFALHDTLTGLPNRAAFNQKLSDCIEAADASGRPFAVLCVDLDRFKEVNDLCGHSAGDSMLQQAAARFALAAAPHFVARVGGDEFILVLEGDISRTHCANVADALIREANVAFDLVGARIAIGASIGIALFPDDGPASGVLARADAALYRAKADGRNALRFYDSALGAALHRRQTLAQELKLALPCDELEAHYQPQANARGEIVGFEALMRWNHPLHGAVPPSEFIPIAEETGLIVAFDAWMLREACREAASWPNPLRVAVNISPIQLRQPDFAQLVQAVLQETGLPPRRLELEITESVVVDDIARVTAMLRQLKTLGVGLAIDDFGAGYSALSYLQDLPIDRIKIDRSFVARLKPNNKSHAIIRAIVTLGECLGLSVIAEGVETRRQFSLLAKAGCQEAQGYLIGRPAPIAQYADVVAVGMAGGAVAYAAGEVISSGVRAAAMR